MRFLAQIAMVLMVMMISLCTLAPETTNPLDTPPVLDKHYRDTTVRQSDTVRLAVSAHNQSPNGPIAMYYLDKGGNG